MAKKRFYLEAELEKVVDRFDMLPRGGAAIVGFSAGPDSTALLAALASLAPGRGAKLIALHVDHGVRGEEARADCRAAGELARELGVPFRSVRLERRDLSDLSENRLRKGRFEAIRKEAAREKIAALFLGHHADDLAETLLMRLTRGAGLEGLASFGPVERSGSLRLLRPLIGLTRAEIIEYLRLRGLSHRIDSSNNDPKYLRNRLRLQIIPLLEDAANPRVNEAMARTARLLKTDADFLGGLTEKALAERGRFFAVGSAALAIDGWADIHAALRTRILREFCRRAAEEDLPPYSRHLADLDALALSSRTGRYLTGWAGMVAFRDSGLLRLARPQASGRPSKSEIFRALRDQTLADSQWKEPVAMPLLLLGRELIENPPKHAVDLAVGKGRVGDIRWRLSLAEKEDCCSDSEKENRGRWRMFFNWPLDAPLRLAQAPLDQRVALRSGAKGRTIASRLGERGSRIPLFWREALVALISDRIPLFVAGLGALAPLRRKESPEFPSRVLELKLGS